MSGPGFFCGEMCEKNVNIKIYSEKEVSTEKMYIETTRPTFATVVTVLTVVTVVTKNCVTKIWRL